MAVKCGSTMAMIRRARFRESLLGSTGTLALSSRPSKLKYSCFSTLHRHVLCVFSDERRQQPATQRREQSSLRVAGGSRWNQRISQQSIYSVLVSPNTSCSSFGGHQPHHQLQRRHVWTSLPAWMNDITSTLPFWGHSAALLKTIHMDGAIPYWACFPLINVLLRVCLFPLVIHSAHVGIRFSKVAPDLQLLFAVYARDYQRLVQNGAGMAERIRLARQTFRTMSSLLKYNQANPLTFFYAPLIQIPVYYYCANDLRRVMRGADPDLAQALTDAPVTSWIPNLTEADPWNILPISAGAVFYLNLEYSLRAKPGERPTYLLILIKDVLQSVAVLTPAFLGSAPAGMQLYALTTFFITGLQNALVKHNAFRPWVGLPLLTEPTKDEGILEIQRKREEAVKQQVVGKGVLQPGTTAVAKWTTTIRSSIPGSAAAAADLEKLATTPLVAITNDMPFIHGISAPRETGQKGRFSFVQVIEENVKAIDREDGPIEPNTTSNLERKEKRDVPKRKKR